MDVLNQGVAIYDFVANFEVDPYSVRYTRTGSLDSSFVLIKIFKNKGILCL
jgi:hypothetical protein